MKILQRREREAHQSAGQVDMARAGPLHPRTGAEEWRLAGLPFRRWWAVTGLAGLLGACSTQATLEDEHATMLAEATGEPLRVEDYYPSDGVPGVPKNIQPYLYFNRALTESEGLELTMEGLILGTLPFSQTLDFDRAGVAFVPQGAVTPLELSSPMTFSVVAEAEQSLIDQSMFSAAFPEGPLFNMSTGLKVEAFGGSKAQALLLQSFFTPGVYPLWIMVPEGLSAQTQLPTSVSMYMGPAYVRSGGTYRIYRHVGFSTLFPEVYVEADGSFSAELKGEFLPLDTPEAVVPAWMASVSMRGRLDLTSDPMRIEGLELEAIVPTRALLLLAETSESYATAIQSLTLDVDLNGNGVNDSATFRVSASPEQIPVSLWDP